MSAHALFDAPGPRGRLTIRVVTGLSVLLAAGLAALVYWQLYRTGQLAPSKWRPFAMPGTIEYLLDGLRGTAVAALGSAVLALPAGLLLALGRVSRHRWLSWPSIAFIEGFRAVPVLLVIYAFMFALPQYGLNLSHYWKLVTPITLCAAAVLAEVFRAGMLAVPRGQSEAALALGLREGAVKRIVVLPQALRMVVPALVAQAVVVVKDTAFGYVVSYPELMQSGKVLVANTNNLVQTYLVITAIYVVVNVLISILAQRLEMWLNRRGGRGSTSILAKARRSTIQ